MSDLAEIRDQLANIQRSLGRVEGTLAAVTRNMIRGTQRMDDHEARTTKLEHKQMRSTGFAAGVAAVFGTAAGIVGALTGHKLGWPTH